MRSLWAIDLAKFTEQRFEKPCIPKQFEARLIISS
jgi:hypothetical protein